MSSELMKSVSGIRGIVGKSLTPELITTISCAFAKYCKNGKIVLGRDSRSTGDIISKQVESVLMMCGCHVINVGIVPTPTVEIMIKEVKADGGIIISASHNPIEWNAFKLVGSDGTFLNSVQIAKFFKLMEQNKSYAGWDKLGSSIINDKASGIHIKKVLKISNVRKIKSKSFKVSLDSVNGAGSIITKELLDNLGCKVNPVFCTITGTFPRVAEPLVENLTDLSKSVIKNKSDIGFAQDPDADRLAIVDEKGTPIGEELTISLVAKYLLSKKIGPVVVNLSTTKIIEDIAKSFKAPFFRSKVGEINVVDVMRKKNALIGGEGNGGVISPDVHLGRDSLTGIGYILSFMAETGKTVSQLVKDLPNYVMKKGKVTFDKTKLDKIYTNLLEEFNEEKISKIDGIRIDFVKNDKFKGGWVHLRPSNTEPIFRIISEGITDKQASNIFNYFKGILSAKK